MKILKLLILHNVKNYWIVNGNQPRSSWLKFKKLYIIYYDIFIIIQWYHINNIWIIQFNLNIINVIQNKFYIFNLLNNKSVHLFPFVSYFLHTFHEKYYSNNGHWKIFLCVKYKKKIFVIPQRKSNDPRKNQQSNYFQQYFFHAWAIIFFSASQFFTISICIQNSLCYYVYNSGGSSQKTVCVSLTCHMNNTNSIEIDLWCHQLP